MCGYCEMYRGGQHCPQCMDWIPADPKERAKKWKDYCIRSLSVDKATWFNFQHDSSKEKK